jgi:aminopeptidase N
LFGREVFKKGIAAYFKEFSWKNTKLPDFINHMDKAAKELKLDIGQNFKDWSATWLKTAGCNTIWHDIEEKDGKIKKFTVN